MKRKAVFLLVAMVLSGMTVNASQAQITEEEAKAVALEDAGLKEEETALIRTKVDREDGWEIIEVEFFTQDNEEYDYEIIAEDGTILSVSYDWENARGSGKEMTLEEAKEAAAEHAGEKADEVTFVKEETEEDDGRLVHEIEFYTGDQKEYDYEIDAETGVILSWDYDGKTYIRLKEKK
ncbi:MAG: PepSY domain-containing protein [Lachnospiraceae bacterium]|nr:PepSY domain-containing protein [Lachnospiraceae bacterium]